MAAASSVHDFTVKGEAIACPDCDATAEPEAVTIDETHRFEGASDPDDLSTVFALSDGPCGHKGILVTAFGPAADADEAEDVRDTIDDILNHRAATLPYEVTVTH